MAKKAKRDFDLDAVLSAIEIINGSGLLEEPIEVDDDDADATAKNFIAAVSILSDDELTSLPTAKDIAELMNEGLPDRLFEDDEAAPAVKAEQKEENDPDDDPEPEEEPEEKPKKPAKTEKKEKKFKPECPQFGEFNEDDDNCAICRDDYAEEYKLCVASVEEAKKAKAAKPKKPAKVKEVVEEEDTEEVIEEKPKKPAKTAKPKKVEEEEEPVEEKKSFRSGKPKAKEEETEKAAEKPSRRKALSSLTGKKVADFFRRIAIGGVINECVVKSTKSEMVVAYVNESANIFAQVISNFSIPYIGTFAIGDISKIIKFAGSVGDGDLEIEVTQDRFVMKSHSNKVQLLLSTPETIQTAPGKDEATGEDMNIEDIVSGTNSSTIISLDTGKDIIFDTKLIKSDKLMVSIEDDKLYIIGGDNSSDKFKIELKKPEYGADPIDRDLQISANNFAAILGVACLSDQPMELLFASDEEYAVVLRQGEDVWACDLDAQTAE